MGQYALKGRHLRLDDSWDVIVAGGGPAGCTAAASAAREGARTLLIEATGCLGGMGTSGLVPAWCPFTDGKRIIYGGMAERVLKETMAGMPHVAADQFNWTPIDAERLKRVYDDLVTDSGAEVLFNAMVAAVEMDGDGVVDALIVASKAGLVAYKAGVYVDCSGDADVAAWAGAQYEKGDEEGDLQPASHCFVISNVDMYGYLHCGSVKYGRGPALIDDIVASGKYPEIPDTHACNNIVGPGAVGFNAGHVWDVDNTDPVSVSRAMMQGRKIAAAFRDALAEFFPAAFGNSWLAATGSLMGIRETRRIVGDYYLTVDDFLARRTFDDEICRNCYFIDVHHKKAQIGEYVRDTDGEWTKTRHIRLDRGESHGIPYRCLTPKGLRNVLVAGRAISTDRPVQGSTRVMPVCLSMGEAAGMAAALAAGQDPADTRSVDVSRLRARLREEGAYLPDAD